MRIEYNEEVSFSRVKPIDLKTLPLRPLLHRPPVNSKLKPVRINLAICKSRRRFEKRIINPRRNTDTAGTLLRRSGNRNKENEHKRHKSGFHDLSR